MRVSLQNSNFHGTASLKAISTQPPMSAAEHDRITQEKLARRRRVEEAKDEAEIDRRNRLS